MAILLSEKYVGNVYGNWYLRLYEDSVYQSIDGNYSTVNLRLTLYADKVTWVAFDVRDAWIHGTHFAIAYRHDNGEHNLGTASIRMDHASDGSGSYSVGYGMATSYVLNGSEAGGRVLPVIPRASSFSISGDTLNSSITINITRASASFTHTVRYQFGSISRDYVGQSTSCVFTPPISDASQIPNAGSGQATITVFTYNGTTLLGSKSAPVTLNLPTTVIPSFTTLNITRVENGVPTTFGIYVQNKSKANLSIAGAAGIYGSTIKSYKITGGGYSADSSTLNTGVLSISGTVTFTGVITDSRGRTATKTVNIMVYENSLPSLSLKAERCTSTGVLNNNGTYLKITPIYTCANVNAKNYIASKTFSISGTSYKNITGVSGTAFILGNNDILISKSYDVTGVVVDALGQSSGTITIKVSSSSVPINMRDDQTGIAFGKYAEKANTFDSAWDIFIKGEKVISNPYPIGSIYTSVNNVNPTSLFGGTWVAYSQGRTLVGVDTTQPEFDSVKKAGGHKNMQAHGHPINLTSSTNGNHGHVTEYHYFANGTGTTYGHVVGGSWVFGSPMNGVAAAGNHNHTISGATTDYGLGNAQNLQPYITVYFWLRTA